MSFRRPLLALLAVLATLAVIPAAAHASAQQESIFQDDDRLVFGTLNEMESTLSIMRSLGADRVRVTVFWRLVAPGQDSPTKPEFGAGGASDPAAYRPGAWNRYDRIVAAAARNGLELLFNPTVPGPLWASREPGRGRPMHDPDPAEFGAFVTALGRRYSGTYIDEQPTPPSGRAQPCAFPLLLDCPDDPPAPAPAPTVLPRVGAWSIQNEPNQPQWLRPQALRINGRTVPTSPRIYRGLVDSAYRGLLDTGHARDQILIGETAARGLAQLNRITPMRPLLFVRELYCLDSRLRPYRGGAAAARGCPVDAAGSARFAGANPGLFGATGWAHHPYALELRPDVPDIEPDHATMASLPRLTRALDRVMRRYGSQRRLPLWLTEYGYQTDPPDPIIGVPLRTQADYINQADFIAYRNRRVRSVAQFLLTDDEPDRSVPPSAPRYWGSTFQSGLLNLDGTRKPSYAAYERPITALRGRDGRLRLYGQLRPAGNGAALRAQLELQPRGSRAWRRLSSQTTSSLRNTVVFAGLRAAAGSRLRLVWTAGSSRFASRAVKVPRARRRPPEAKRRLPPAKRQVP